MLSIEDYISMLDATRRPAKLSKSPPAFDNSWEIKDEYLSDLINHLDRLTSEERKSFLECCIRQESIYSSKIENIFCSEKDLVIYEGAKESGAKAEKFLEKSSLEAAIETSNAINALRFGVIDVLDGRCLEGSTLGMHAILMRGKKKVYEAGKYRSIQNWIGGSSIGLAKFMPPAPAEIQNLMSYLFSELSEKISDKEAVLMASWVHGQFESIHPFVDGNGRIGRSLVTLYLMKALGVKYPFLFVSKQIWDTRREYYESLNSIRQSEEGFWDEWMMYFTNIIAKSLIFTLEDLKKFQFSSVSNI